MCSHHQKTLQNDASAQPAPAAAAAAPAVGVNVTTVAGVDPEKAKQLTEAVAEQVRSLLAVNQSIKRKMQVLPLSHHILVGIT